MQESDLPARPARGAVGADSLPVPAQLSAGGVDLGVLRVAGRVYSVKAFPGDAGKVTEAGRPVYWLVGERGALHRTMRNVPRPDRMFVMSGGRSLATLAWLTDAGGILRVLS